MTEQALTRTAESIYLQAGVRKKQVASGASFPERPPCPNAAKGEFTERAYLTPSMHERIRRASTLHGRPIGYPSAELDEGIATPLSLRGVGQQRDETRRRRRRVQGAKKDS